MINPPEQRQTITAMTFSSPFAHCFRVSIFQTGLAIATAATTALLGHPATAATFSQVITLGDSLVDTGNTFSQTGVPSDPHVNGRYSNGLLWNEYLADDLDIPLTNLGFAGASSGEFGSTLLPDGELVLLPGLLPQVASYTAGAVDPDALYGLWAGTIDYLFLDTFDPNGPVGNITAAVNQLSEAGAQHFLLVNLPDLGNLPITEALGLPLESRDFLNAATAGHNQLLAEAVDNFNAAGDISVSLLDVNELFDRIAAGELGLANTVDACLSTPNCMGDPTVQSTFLFWDEVHLTTAANRLVADAALTTIEPRTIPEPVMGLGLAIAGMTGLFVLSRE